MSNPEEKAESNTFKVVQLIRQLQMQSSNHLNVQYRIGHLLMDNATEIGILKYLEGQGLITIEDSWGSDSSR